MSKIAEVAFLALYDESDYNYNFGIKYSRKFSAYNANVRYLNRDITFSLSHLWKEVSPEIVIGVLQHLMLKVFKDKHQAKTNLTINIDLYNNFIKNIHKYSHKTEINTDLKQVFDSINEEYFSGLMEDCNLKWGDESTRTLGHYSYGSDTITMSSIFRDLDLESPLLRFVMYHEMLHKKHKFYSTKSGRNMHHSPDFKFDENKFENKAQVEKQLSNYIRNWNYTEKPKPRQVKRITKNSFTDLLKQYLS